MTWQPVEVAFGPTAAERPRELGTDQVALPTLRAVARDCSRTNARDVRIRCERTRHAPRLPMGQHPECKRSIVAHDVTDSDSSPSRMARAMLPRRHPWGHNSNKEDKDARKNRNVDRRSGPSRTRGRFKRGGLRCGERKRELPVSAGLWQQRHPRDLDHVRLHRQ